MKSESIPKQNMIIMNVYVINIKLRKYMGPTDITSLQYNGCREFQYTAFYKDYPRRKLRS